MLTRSFLPESERPSILAYSPMLHARLFADNPKYRDQHFQPTRAAMLPSARDYDPKASSSSSSADDAAAPYLDGNHAIDRPLLVQFCANDPKALLEAAKLVAPYCDAVDLNLGCPQGIARKGRYGAFLQEDQELVHSLVRTLHENLPVPVTAKIRILETKEATLAYARNVLAAGASILTVHGRRREQKGHLTGVADWEYIRYLRDHLPRETVLFANGNVLQHGDLRRCLDATGADGVMAAEGNLSDPALFAAPPAPGNEGREYWRGRDGRGGWRVDAVLRRYLDIMHEYVVGQRAPARRPLFVPGDDEGWLRDDDDAKAADDEPARKKRRKDGERPAVKMTSGTAGPNLVAMQAHLFHLLRHFVTKHHDVRDALARSKLGDISVHERILDMVERKVAEGLLEYESTDGKSVMDGEDAGRNGAFDKGCGAGAEAQAQAGEEECIEDDPDSSVATVRRCKRPWWVAQPIIRPLPKEALAKGAVSLSKKDKQKLAAAAAAAAEEEPPVTVAKDQVNGDAGEPGQQGAASLEKTTSFPDSGLVSG